VAGIEHSQERSASRKGPYEDIVEFVVHDALNVARDDHLVLSVLFDTSVIGRFLSITVAGVKNGEFVAWRGTGNQSCQFMDHVGTSRLQEVWEAGTVLEKGNVLWGITIGPNEEIPEHVDVLMWVFQLPPRISWTMSVGDADEECASLQPHRRAQARTDDRAWWLALFDDGVHNRGGGGNACAL
jgi:hypothetical protein